MPQHQSASTRTETPTLGSRENFFAHTDDDEPTYEEVAPPSERGPQYGVTKEAWYSKSILLKYGDPTLLCPRCLHQEEIASELSEPADYLPPAHVIEVDISDPDAHYPEWVPFSDQDQPLADFEDGEVRRPMLYADHRRHRHCTRNECSHYSWGGLLQDRPKEAFLEIVAITLDDIYGVVQKRDEYYATAQSRKATGMTDVKNHRKLIQELEAGDPDLHE